MQSNDLNKNLINHYSDGKYSIIKKVSPKFIAKNKAFNKKTIIKKYAVTLKTVKKTWIALKINGKLFKAKTNNKGKATFKITKLNKKGKYAAILKYNGNSNYNAVTKKVKIVIG